MLELDLDLEGDLGIDTVKQVEVFARVRDELGRVSHGRTAMAGYAPAGLDARPVLDQSA
jgi:hypothetical protein